MKRDQIVNEVSKRESSRNLSFLFLLLSIGPVLGLYLNNRDKNELLNLKLIEIKINVKNTNVESFGTTSGGYLNIIADGGTKYSYRCSTTRYLRQVQKLIQENDILYAKIDTTSKNKYVYGLRNGSLLFRNSDNWIRNEIERNNRTSLALFIIAILLVLLALTNVTRCTYWKARKST